ncbi:MAG: sensor domain-containing diguanylate cyclase [Sulfurospirillaceae bacterium]|nr:sensor domain-containing diguanylate cyclase [Sulfurospirillaceae bacterium]MDD3462654.1 sensor domain-containing diguanylate cyclase [Sulfurospirillaceae bacterium]
MKNLETVKSLGIHKIRFIYTSLFVFFGFVIALVSYFSSSYIHLVEIQKDLKSSAPKELDIKIKTLQNHIKNLDIILETIAQSDIFKTYLEDAKNQSAKKNAHDLFYAVAKNHSNLMQLRYIDAKGMEKIRYDRLNLKDDVLKIEDKELQDKSDRYYFKEALKAKPDESWYSLIDLNIEHGAIEIPIKPVLRIAKSIHTQNGLEGIVIINIFMEEILDELRTSSHFRVSLLDRDGDFILHSEHQKGTEIFCDWVKYLKPTSTCNAYTKDELAQITKGTYAKGEFFYKAIKTNFAKADGLIISLKPKIEKIKEASNQQKIYLFIIAISIFAISIPVAFFISLIPANLHKKLTETARALQKLSITDELTTLYNRRFFNETISRELSRSKRNNLSLAFCIFDIDFFKLYNDTYGHLAGDVALKSVALVLKNSARRSGDFAFRLGGEEFGLIVSSTTEEDIKKLIAELLEKIESLKIANEKSTISAYVTLSAGVVLLESSTIQEVDEEIVFKIADDALYEAKAKGRNCFVFSKAT